MALYWTSSGLQRLAQSESSGRADLVHYPSGYAPNGKPSSASGLYGYLDGTWQTYASRAGVDTSVYPRAYMAPADVQTAVAAQTPISHWTCPGCNSVASNMAGNPQYVSTSPGYGGPIQSDPSYEGGTRLEIDDPQGAPGVVGPTSTDVTGTGVSSGTGTGAGTGTSTSTAGGVGMGTPVTVGLQKGTIDNITKWVNTNLTEGVIKPVQKFFGSAQNWFQRALIMIVALIILLVALWKLAGEPPIPGVGAIGKMAKV